MVYMDADWASDADRKSNSGFVVWVKGCRGRWYMVSLGSKKQSVVALSSGESELVSMLNGVVEMIGLQAQWKFVGLRSARPCPDHEADAAWAIIGSDSTAAIGIVRRQGATRRTRHMEMKAFYLQSFASLPPTKVVKSLRRTWWPTV